MTPALHPTYIVSFPRSGQHLVIRGLMWVMPDLVVYSERYQVGHSFENNPAVNIQKEHDFDLSLPIVPEFRYLVLFRDFEPALKSWWRLTVGNGMEDTEENFRQWFVGKREYWMGFEKRWLAPGVAQMPNVKCFDFYRLATYPEDCLHEIIAFVLNFMPKELAYANSRPEAFTSFVSAVKTWQWQSKPQFKYQHVLDLQ